MITLIYLLVIGVFISIDWYFIERKDTELNKRVMWYVRAVVTISFALLAKSFNLIDSLLYVGFLAFLFYALFDYGLNLALGKSFWHKGQNPIDIKVPGGIPGLSIKIIGLLGSYAVYQYQFFLCLKVELFDLFKPEFWRDVKYCMELMI